jgi:hypothetical protein
VAGLWGRLRPDLVLHAGDVVYPSGAEKDYEERFFAPCISTFSRRYSIDSGSPIINRSYLMNSVIQLPVLECCYQCFTVR